MNIDWVTCPECENEQEEDCDNDSFVCDKCGEIFHYDKSEENELC